MQKALLDWPQVLTISQGIDDQLLMWWIAIFSAIRTRQHRQWRTPL